MPQLELTSIAKSFGSTKVISDLSLSVAAGEFIVFVGPSGCGKSTLLRIIAGLEDVSSGTVAIGGRSVNNLSPKARGVAMVFQNYALYPHMTVYNNMAFGLKLADVGADEIERRVADAAKLLNITEYLERKPGQLSGGQKQRVAIGRAMVKRPQVFLFDEPLSNLDAQLRVKMRAEIAALHKRLQCTVIYVTHDQVEAMTLADRVVVLKDGRTEQVGSPLELYNAPATKFVAGFMGTPPMNLLPASFLPAAMVPHGAETLGFRSEDAVIVAAAEPAPSRKSEGLVLMDGQVKLVELLGPMAHVHLELPSRENIICEGRGSSRIPRLGETRIVTVMRERLFFFDATGARLNP